MLKFYTFRDASNSEITINLYTISAILIPSILDDQHAPLVCFATQIIKVTNEVANDVKAKWLALEMRIN